MKALAIAALALLLAAPAAAETWWLSDVAPGPAGRGGEHNHGGPVERGRGGAVHKRLWLRAGATVAADYAHALDGPATIRLLDPRRQVAELALTPQDHGSLAFPMPHEGYYNLYLVTERPGAVGVAKAEVLRHSCREGHDHVAPLVPANAWDDAPIDILRERLPLEDFHTLLGSGDTVAFRVVLRGRPAAGARVTMHTQQGWSRSATADGEGRVSFQLIRDYYPEWRLFDRRHRETFLVEARHRADGVDYIATYSGAYHPSARDYASYGYGLSAALVGFALTGGGVLLLRRRRPRVVAR